MASLYTLLAPDGAHQTSTAATSSTVGVVVRVKLVGVAVSKLLVQELHVDLWFFSMDMRFVAAVVLVGNGSLGL